MGGIETPLVAPLERRVTGNESAGLEDADLIGKNMNVEDAAAGRVRHAVEIAADAHHAFVGDPPFEFENRPIRGERQRLQGRLFLGEGLVERGLATVSSQCRNWALRSSRLRKEPPRKKSSRM